MTTIPDSPAPQAPSFDRATVRALLDLFAVEGSEFSHNEANDYGVINLTLFTGPGNPWQMYRGEEILGQYLKRGSRHETEERGTGTYRLNDRLVDQVLEQMRHQALRRAGVTVPDEASVYVVRLVPAFDGHPAFPRTYYSGKPVQPGDYAPTTLELDGAARYLSREAAAEVASALLPTKSCVWVVQDLVNEDHMAFSTHEPVEDTLARLSHREA